MAGIDTPITVTLYWGTNYEEVNPGDVAILKGVFDTEKEACAAMVADWEAHGNKVYYTRTWRLEDDRIEVVDYGSHIYFYFLIFDYLPFDG